MTERVECAVIGAGVIGLAVARRLALAGIEVVILERADMIGTETSSRNSEIVHAGIYYPTGSLKARSCVAGKHALYDYCAANGIAHRRCGKFIVATEDGQVEDLAALKTRAAANGVADLAWLTPSQVAEMEPAVHCVAALHSPSTGIVDSHGLMLSFQGEAEASGAMIAYHAPVAGGRVEDDGILVDVGGETPMALKADRLVNAAGIWAPAVARTIAGLDPASVPSDYLCKGNYYTLAGKSPFTRPVYPVPEKAGLGVHVTVDLAGQARFGPDVEWIDSIDYDVDPGRADAFYAAIRRYWPGLPDGAIQAGYAGIRPKLQAPGEPAADFVVQGPSVHGIDGLVNLYGIESPGLTASLALADMVAEIFSGGC
ncbi:MAG: NAD(P)/FAD-dependent oxidoreductase [Defluviicoccus sp.]|nr:NAD(P)/FAD-dependent oxidoreductase [Defluviicoccus sp.]MDE0386657.1 NAD(P)/FAD-dependent oxidoreductase [Defluviicoccus sp.]